MPDSRPCHGHALGFRRIDRYAANGRETYPSQEQLGRYDAIALFMHLAQKVAINRGRPCTGSIGTTLSPDGPWSALGWHWHARLGGRRASREKSHAYEARIPGIVHRKSPS